MFHVFAGDTYYAHGFDDYRGAFATLEEALAVRDEAYTNEGLPMYEYDWLQVLRVNDETGRLELVHTKGEPYGG